MYNTRTALCFAIIAAANVSTTASCGPSTPAEYPQTSETSDTPIQSQRTGNSLEIQTELGVLDEAAVRSTFERLWRGPMNGCQRKGGDNIAGVITIRTRIDHSGKAKWTYLKESNLGDRNVERCILDTVRNASWPSPQGGEDGIAEQQLSFDDYATRPPIDWPASKTSPALHTYAAKMAHCHADVTGKFVATAIINTDGSVASVGIQQPNETSDAAADCIVALTRDLSFPSPGSWPAKVSFDVP